MRTLALESSCDETSAAVVWRDGNRINLEGLSILSQDIHRIFGGVVPELASRAHLVMIQPVVEEAMAQAGIRLEDLDGVVVTQGPGLLGALLVGVMWAKTLAWRTGLPFLGVHHLEGHLFAPVFEHPELTPPFTALLVSGGHTMLLDVPQWGTYQLLGQTRDDAAGEAFDKAGSLLGLEYPAGAAIERLAAQGNPARYRFPRPLLRNSKPGQLDFSFSGLKTAVLRAVQQSSDLERERADLARGFQDAVIDVLVSRTTSAARLHQRSTIVLGGGVACNQTLATAMAAACTPWGQVVVATPRLNTDNAAMIGAAGSWRLARGERSGFELEARDAMPLPGLISSTGVSV